jgi:flagellar biogenesis protein FliO
MTTSASGWPKLSHQRCRRASLLLVLCAGIFVAAARADAQTQSRDPYPASASDNSRAAVRRPALPEGQEAIATPVVATPAAPNRTSHHKTWKEVSRTHNEEKSRDASSPSFSPWTAFGALAMVICLILILARIFRRHAPLFSQALPAEALEVLGRRFVDQRQSIVLLRIGSRILVVGSSAAGLQGIGELTDPVEVDLIAGMCRGTRTGYGIGSSFLSLLRGQTDPQTNPRARRESPRRTESGHSGSRHAESRDTEPHRTEPYHTEPYHTEPYHTELHRPEPRTPEASIADERPSARMADPQHELMRRLRTASSAGAPRSGDAEVFGG